MNKKNHAPKQTKNCTLSCLSFSLLLSVCLFPKLQTGPQVFTAQNNIPDETREDRYDEVFSESNNSSFTDDEFVMINQFSEERCNVVNELLTTELDYLESLEVVRDQFIQPLTQAKMLAEDELQIIFINWNDVLLVTNRLYKSLKIRRKMTSRADISIGDVLCENVIISFKMTLLFIKYVRKGPQRIFKGPQRI